MYTICTFYLSSVLCLPARSVTRDWVTHYTELQLVGTHQLALGFSRTKGKICLDSRASLKMMLEARAKAVERRVYMRFRNTVSIRRPSRDCTINSGMTPWHSSKYLRLSTLVWKGFKFKCPRAKERAAALDLLLLAMQCFCCRLPILVTATCTAHAQHVAASALQMRKLRKQKLIGCFSVDGSATPYPMVVMVSLLSDAMKKDKPQASSPKEIFVHHSGRAQNN